MDCFQSKSLLENAYQNLVCIISLEDALFIELSMEEGCKKILRLRILCIGTNMLPQDVWCALPPQLLREKFWFPGPPST